MAYKFPARIASAETIRGKQFSLLPGCGCVRTFKVWVYRGLLNSSRTRRVRLPSQKHAGQRVTTIDAFLWWQQQLQT
jgi:hypothetical protein